MTDRSDELYLKIICRLLPDVSPFHLDVSPDSLVADVTHIARQKVSTPEALDEERDRWTGSRTGIEWTLRENRDIEEGKWWTEAEVKSYQDPLLSPNDSLPPCTSFELIPPCTPVLAIQIFLPTTTSSLPIRIGVPLAPLTTAFEVLDILRADLGLPTSTSNLIGYRGRGEKSRSRSRSHVSSIFSGAGSDAGADANDEIQWKVTLGSAGGVMSLEEVVMDKLKGKGDTTLVVGMDEGWLLEKAKPELSSTETPTATEEEESDTLKASNSAGTAISPRLVDTVSPLPSFRDGASSSTRLSGLFHGWLESNQHPAPPPSPQLSIASGHVVVRSPLNGLALQDALKGEGPWRPLLTTAAHNRPHSVSGQLRSPSSADSPELKTTAAVNSPTVEANDEEEWEGFLNDLNLYGEKRDAMTNLSPDRKAYLLLQSHTSSLVKSPHRSPPIPDTSSPQPASSLSLSAGTSLGLTRLLPQLTGSNTDSTRSPNPAKHGWTKGISIASLGSWAGVSTSTDPDHLGVAKEEEDGETTPRAEVASISGMSVKSYADTKAMERQYTGGLWGWWTGSNKPEEGSPAHFVEGLRNAQKSSSLLNKHLVSLRVTLSTAKIDFLHEFLDLSGLDTISESLHRLLPSPIEGGSVSEQNVVEIIKCLRVLMNTDAGFTGVLDRPVLLARIAETFHIPTYRLRCQAAELLSALCILSPHEGHNLVLSAISEMKGPSNNNLLRFQWLVNSLETATGFQEEGSDTVGRGSNIDGVWDWRVAVLGLLNVLANTPDSLEMRCGLRGELERRGLIMALEMLRYQSPPESWFAQVNLYEEESREDWAELRWLNLSEVEGGIHTAAGALIRAAQEVQGVHDLVMELLQRCTASLTRETQHDLKLKLMKIMAKFSEHNLDMVDVDEDWPNAITRFMIDVQGLVPLAPALRTDAQMASAISTTVGACKGQVDSESQDFGSGRPINDADGSSMWKTEEARSHADPCPSFPIRSTSPSPSPPPPPPPPPLPPTLPLMKAFAPPAPLPSPPPSISYSPDRFASSSGISKKFPLPPPPPPPPPPLPPTLSQPKLPVLSLSPPAPRPPPPAPAFPSASQADPLERSLPPAPPPPPGPIVISGLNLNGTSPPPPPPPPPPLAATASSKVSPLAPGAPLAPGPPLTPGPSRKGVQKPASPKTKLKPFFWSKLPQYSVKNTVWNQVDLGSELALDDLADIFALNDVPTVKADPKGKAKAAAVISMLDITRSNNVGIMLVRLRMSPKKIKRAILEVDDDMLSEEDLAALSRLLPSAEESERLKAFEGEIDKLAKPDQYFREISTIPNLKGRLDAMVFRRRFDPLLGEIMPDLGTMRSAALELKECSRFKEVLGVVLTLGNALNGGTFRGNAAGFQIEALAKMKETRTAKGAICPTLLHYLAKVLVRTDARLILFLEDMPSLEPAARYPVSLPELTSSVKSLKRSLATTTATSLFPPSCPEDALQEVLQPFVRSAQLRVDKLDRLNVDLQKELSSLLSFFGEKDGSVETLFSTVLTFAHGLQKAAAEMTRHALRDEEARVQQLKATEGVSRGTVDAMSQKLDKHEAMLSAVTIKKPKVSAGGSAGSYFLHHVAPVPEAVTPTLAPPGLAVASDGTLARKKSARATLSRGELDEAIRNIHGGVKRRERDTLGRGGVRLSKMFLDGGQSRGTVGAAAGNGEGMSGTDSMRIKEGSFQR